MQRKDRGTALPAVFMVIGIALIVAFSLASSSVFQIRVAASTVARSQALDLAESALACGIGQVMDAQIAQVAVSPTLTINNATPGTLSYLTFIQANPQELPWSVNNLTGKSSVTGPLPNEVVPPASVALVGTGQAGGIQVEVEAVVHFPAYPYVVASSGPFRSPNGGVTVASAAGLTLPQCGPVCPKNYVPGDLVSNSFTNPAISLGQCSKVTGCVQAPGSMYLAPSAKVLGAVQTGANPVPLPCVAIKDPTLGYAGVAMLGPCGGGCGSKQVFGPSCPQNSCNPCALPPGSTVITGMARANQNVTFPADLQLNGAILFINGDLTVTGKLRGMGAILGTGKMTFAGGAALTAQNIVALLAGRDIAMTGGSCNASVFNGLVYTKGSLSASNLQLYGNFVANSGCVTGCCAGKITMCNVKVVGTASLVGLTLASSSVTTTSSSSCTSCICLVTIPTTGNAINLNNPQCHAFFSKGASTGTTCPKCVKNFNIHKCPSGGYTVTGPCPTCPSKTKSTSFLAGSCPPAKCQAAKYAIGIMGVGQCCTMYCCALKKEEEGVLACCYLGCGPPPPPIARGPFVRLKCTTCTVGGVVFNFNFNQFIQPADQTRLLLWRQI